MSVESREIEVVAEAPDTQVATTVVETTAASVPARAVSAAPAAAARVTTRLNFTTDAALARVQSAAGQLIPQLQYQIMRLGTAGQAGLAALVAALAVTIGALLPAYHTLQSLNASLANAQHPSAAQTLEQLGPRLVASLPTRSEIPGVLGQIFTEAKDAGVSLDTGRYVYTPAKGTSIAHYDLEFPVKGASYPGLRTFINRTLTVVPAASLGTLHIERKVVGDQVVNADIGFVVFVRSGEAQ